jgi:hypothetical protein
MVRAVGDAVEEAVDDVLVDDRVLGRVAALLVPGVALAVLVLVYDDRVTVGGGIARRQEQSRVHLALREAGRGDVDVLPGSRRHVAGERRGDERSSAVVAAVAAAPRGVMHGRIVGSAAIGRRPGVGVG